MIYSNIIDKIFIILITSLLFVLVYVMAASVGAFGSTDLYGLGRVLMLIEGVVFFYLITNLARLRSLPKILTIVLGWTLWVLITNINFLFPIDSLRLLQSTLEMLLWVCIYFFFYVYFKKNPAYLDVITILYTGLLLFVSYLYFNIFSSVTSFTGTNFKLINFVYYSLILMPCVLLVKWTVVRYFSLLLIGVTVLSSLKRTAFICFVLALCLHEIIEYNVRNKSLKPLYYLLGLFSTIILYYFSFLHTNLNLQIFSRFSDALDDRGSNRLDIYFEVLQLIKNSNWDDYLIGHGHNSVITYTTLKASAHNDWLEVFFDYGFPGLILYTLLHIQLVKMGLSLIRSKSTFSGPFAASYVIFFVMSLTSHLIIYPTFFIFIAGFWGMATAYAHHNYIIQDDN